MNATKSAGNLVVIDNGSLSNPRPDIALTHRTLGVGISFLQAVRPYHKVPGGRFREVTTLLFCSALAVTPQRHDMDRKRAEAGRMVRRRKLSEPVSVW